MLRCRKRWLERLRLLIMKVRIRSLFMRLVVRRLMVCRGRSVLRCLLRRPRCMLRRIMISGSRLLIAERKLGRQVRREQLDRLADRLGLQDRQALSELKDLQVLPVRQV